MRYWCSQHLQLTRQRRVHGLMNGDTVITDWPWFPYTRVVLAGCKFNRLVPQHRNDGDRMSCMWKTAGWGSSALSYTQIT